jgi:hypothetical protein
MFKKLLPFLFLFAGFQANATLIDNGDYSTDDVSGLDWLDWTLTVDKTQAEALTLFSGAGWRIATGAEAIGLIDNHFEVDVPSGPNVLATSLLDYSAKHAQFLGLFGLTGYPATSHATIEWFGLIGSGAYHVYFGLGPSSYGAVGRSSGSSGVALVKVAAVSEPTIIALFALGLVGIGFARRRQS